jgi:hypothetical protein
MTIMSATGRRKCRRTIGKRSRRRRVRCVAGTGWKTSRPRSVRPDRRGWSVRCGWRRAGLRSGIQEPTSRTRGLRECPHMVGLAVCTGHSWPHLSGENRPHPASLAPPWAEAGSESGSEQGFPPVFAAFAGDYRWGRRWADEWGQNPPAKTAPGFGHLSAHSANSSTSFRLGDSPSRE